VIHIKQFLHEENDKCSNKMFIMLENKNKWHGELLKDESEIYSR
jgi:hypothetical protein